MKTIRCLCVLSVLGGGVFVSARAVHASSPKFFQASTQADFLKGEVDNLSIDPRGQLVLGPALDLVYETPAPFVWTIAAAADGTFFLGTGNDGKVYRVGPDGKGALFFTSAELEVHALAPAPNGGLYVATSPDGKIYKVDRDGKGTTFFTPDEKYIWALAIDAKGNCSRRPAKKASSTRSRRTAKARRSTARRPRTRRRWRSTRAATFSSALAPPAKCFASIRRARASCCSTRRFRKSTRCVSTRRACCSPRR